MNLKRIFQALYTCNYCAKLFHIIHIILTLAKYSKERFVNFPTVSVSCFCDLNIMNNKIRVSSGFKLYHAALYAAIPIALLYQK